MEEKTHPLARCKKCGAVSHSYDIIGRTCSCKKGIYLDAQRDADWEKCQGCSGAGGTAAVPCIQCGSCGWLFVGSIAWG